jgi:hypothetical protein
MAVSGGRGAGSDFTAVKAFADSLAAAGGASRGGRFELVRAIHPRGSYRQDCLDAAVSPMVSLVRFSTTPACKRPRRHRGQQGRLGADIELIDLRALGDLGDAHPQATGPRSARAKE